jgi:pimeloyl-ACP methyl ester carboxylesterase
MHVLAFCLSLLSAQPASVQLSDQRYANLGACTLQSGARLAPCTLGYRTFGPPDPTGRRTLVVLTWFTGMSGDWRGFLGPGKVIDVPDARIIVIDALSNGVSSSPSLWRAQAGDFPRISIVDMVDTEHRLLQEVFDLRHVHAVVGVSMGAMQALQWAIRYPRFMDKVVSVAGTPRALPSDMQPWRREVEGPSSLLESSDTHRLAGDDRRMQLRAMVEHDIAPGVAVRDMATLFGAQTLFVVPLADRLLDPRTAMDLAAALGAATVLIPGWCGHLAPMVCARARTAEALSDFLR